MKKDIQSQRFNVMMKKKKQIKREYLQMLCDEFDNFSCKDNV